MTSTLRNISKPLGLVWLECPRSVVVAGLVRALEEHATVYVGSKRPEGTSCIMICAREEEEDLSERIKQHEDTNSHTAPILVFGSHLNLPLARDALRAGASGFVHAGMTPDQLVKR
jgi:FixJ family two-component response regulator